MYGVLKWGRWSFMRKAQVVAAMTGASLTIVMIILSPLDVGPPPHSVAGYYYFLFGLLTTHGLACEAGLTNDAPAWQWNGLSVVLNTALLFLVGTVIGFIGCLIRHRSQKTNDTAA
jgi:hypothetical protein